MARSMGRPASLLLITKLPENSTKTGSRDRVLDSYDYFTEDYGRCRVVELVCSSLCSTLWSSSRSSGGVSWRLCHVMKEW